MQNYTFCTRQLVLKLLTIYLLKSLGAGTLGNGLRC